MHSVWDFLRPFTPAYSIVLSILPAPSPQIDRLGISLGISHCSWLDGARNANKEASAELLTSSSTSTCPIYHVLPQDTHIYNFLYIDTFPSYSEVVFSYNCNIRTFDCRADAQSHLEHRLLNSTLKYEDPKLARPLKSRQHVEKKPQFDLRHI